MEKQGMEKRKRILRPGLLIFTLLYCLQAGYLFSQSGSLAEDLPSLEVRVETMPANPAVNSAWSVYIYVNHSQPQEVKIKPPQFPSSLSLERVRTEGRLVGEERWTRIEFLFTPLRAGEVIIEPFEIGVSDRQAFTDEIHSRFREETKTVRRYNPRLRWQSPVLPLQQGVQNEFIIELTDWDSLKKVPSGFFRARVPRNAILEENLPLKSEADVYRYNIIILPLEESDVVLEPFSFNHEGYTMSVPGMTFKVLPAVKKASSPSAGNASSLVSAGNNHVREPAANGGSFPEGREKVFFLFEKEYNSICERTEALWEKGHWAESFAEIRRNERDSLSGPYLVSLRREMEQKLGLGFTPDEKWRPLKISLPVWVLLFLLLLSAGIAMFVFRPLRGRKKVILQNSVSGNIFRNLRRRSGFRTVIVSILIIGLVLIFIEEGIGNLFISRLSTAEKTAVLKQTEAYRVPDLSGAISARFGEGQPVVVGTYSLDWCYAETIDGRSGWVKQKAVIDY